MVWILEASCEDDAVTVSLGRLFLRIEKEPDKPEVSLTTDEMDEPIRFVSFSDFLETIEGLAKGD
jgi:hypothetical protein